MLKISTRGQYALLIMTDLAEAEEGNFIPLKTLSHRRNLSVKYLEQILIQMGKAGLVTGSRGTNGGYRLTRESNTYTVGEILRAMEGSYLFVRNQRVIILNHLATKSSGMSFLKKSMSLQILIH